MLYWVKHRKANFCRKMTPLAIEALCLSAPKHNGKYGTEYRYLTLSPVSYTMKTGRHDIAEILLKVALNTINQIKYNWVIWNI
jgi:hypothetical protein